MEKIKKVIVGGIYKDDQDNWYNYFGNIKVISGGSLTKEVAVSGLEAKLSQAIKQFGEKYEIIFERKDI